MNRGEAEENSEDGREEGRVSGFNFMSVAAFCLTHSSDLTSGTPSLKASSSPCSVIVS